MGVALLALAAVVVSAVIPVRVGRIELGPATVPPLVLALLFLSGRLDPSEMMGSLIGADGEGAWRIIVLFFCVAYASTSTDVTGLFDYIAYHLVLAVGGSGRRLLFGVYLLASGLTVFTSNDIVILTLTPILFHVGEHARIDVKPLLFAEFFGANTMSMLLVVGNPTNIIISELLGIGFIEYLSIMWLPAITAFLLTALLLVAVFRRRLPGTVVLHAEAMFRVRNWADAIISAVLLALMFVLFVFAGRLGIELWLVSALIAAAFTFEDLGFTLWYLVRAGRRRGRLRGRLRGRRLVPGATFGEREIEVEADEALRVIPEVTNDLYLAHMRVPWKILPFIVVCFVLVDRLALSKAGVAAAGWIFAPDSMTGVVFRSGLGSALLANLVNNQPMSMFVARAIAAAESLSGTTGAIRTAAGFAAIIASNLGANLTVMGALAGIMWLRILSRKGLKVSYGEFLWVGIRIAPPVLIVTLLALVLSLAL